MMDLVQTAPIPAPQAPPVDSYLQLQSQEQILIGVIVVVVSLAAAFVLRPLLAAWARRLEGKQADASLRADVERLRELVADVDPLRTRVLELEERLEFAERLLAERRDHDLLRPGGQSL